MREDVDVEALARTLAARLGCRGLRLTRLGVACRWPVFRAEPPDGSPVFVKVARPEEVRRALRFLSSAGGCRLLPRPVLNEPVPFGGGEVLCLEWKEGRTVFAEEMTDAQAESFLAGCVELSQTLARFPSVLRPDDEDDPVRQHAALAAYAARHPLCGRLFGGLVGLPVGERTYGARPLVPVHGDLQPKNYGFDGETLSAVYDFEELTLGLACEDPAYAFTERCRRLGFGRRRRRERLVELFVRMVEASPWPADEWLVAVNHCRLRIAARRLAKHPDGWWVAADIASRDRPLKALSDRVRECRRGGAQQCVRQGPLFGIIRRRDTGPWSC